MPGGILWGAARALRVPCILLLWPLFFSSRRWIGHPTPSMPQIAQGRSRFDGLGLQTGERHSATVISHTNSKWFVPKTLDRMQFPKSWSAPETQDGKRYRLHCCLSRGQPCSGGARDTTSVASCCCCRLVSAS